MATEPIYLSTDESEYSTPGTFTDHHQENICPGYQPTNSVTLRITVKYGHTDRIRPTNPKYGYVIWR